MRTTLTSILLLIPGLVFSQSFEGTLVYKTLYEFQLSEKMQKMGVTKEALIARMKKDGTWSDSIKTSYKQGSYITYTNFSPQSWSIYKPAVNKLYTFQEGEDADICTVTDVSIDLEFKLTGNKPTITKLDTTITVNGLPCNIVRVQWKTGKYDYYYHPGTLPIDPQLFEKHTYDGWAEFLKISNALPIRIVKSVNGLAHVTFTLSYQKPGPVNESLFTIPKLVADEELSAMKLPNTELFRIKR